MELSVASIHLNYFVVSSSTFPPFATHLLKNSYWDLPDPFALPAAGLPGKRGGNCLAVIALHFLATSAVTAQARSIVQPLATAKSATKEYLNLTPVRILFLIELKLSVRVTVPLRQYAEILAGEKVMFCGFQLSSYRFYEQSASRQII